MNAGILLRRFLLFAMLVLQLVLVGPLIYAASREGGVPAGAQASGAEHTAHTESTPCPTGEDPSKPMSLQPHCVSMGARVVNNTLPTPVTPFSYNSPNHLTHPCNTVLPIYPEPPFNGLSPLSITYVPGVQCTPDPYSAGFGDIAVWQADGHNYVALAGFAQRMYHIWNVDDPYNPVLLRSQSFPGGGTNATSIFAFRQGSNRYMSVTMRGSGTGCGWFLYNVNDPANPQFITRKSGSDWCTVHEHFVSTDQNGDADYAWLTMSGESGSGYKVVVLDLRNINNIVESGRYQRPDSGGSIFNHDSNVVGNLVFLAHWSGGLIIHDKETLAHNVNPTPLNPINSIRPSSFAVHHVVPTSDGNHVLIEDEFINTPGVGKIKMYNISNLSAPYFETEIQGDGVTANNRAHNMRILPLSPGHDLLLDGWYQAGTRGFEVDTTASPPTIQQVLYHQLRQSTNGQFGNVWGVDYLPCTVRGQQKTCIYSGDMQYGLVIDALGYDPMLDPYDPESQITDPVNGQTINTCTYTIRGNAHDYYSGLTRVEVSTDGGSTWQVAQGTTNWTYEWTIPADGNYTLQVRGVDVAGNVETPTASVNVTVTGGCPGLITPTPPPSFTPIPTSTFTPTPVPTDTPTATHTPTSTNTPVAATTTPASTPTPTPTACAISFVDVPTTHPFYPYIRCLACRGIVGGYSDGTFRPDNFVTRGQLSKIVANAAGFSEPVSGQTFSDVPPSHPFYVYIERMAGRGIIGGYSDGTFRPDNNATRGQISKIVANAAGIQDPIPQSRQTFSDVPPTHPFWVYIERLAGRGILGGYSDGTFRPDNNATRGQTAKIVSNTFFPDCGTLLP